MVQKTVELERYQETPEDPETAKCIPMLKREDIRKEITPFTNEALDIDEVCSFIMKYLLTVSAILI